MLLRVNQKPDKSELYSVFCSADAPKVRSMSKERLDGRDDRLSLPRQDVSDLEKILAKQHFYWSDFANEKNTAPKTASHGQFAQAFLDVTQPFWRLRRAFRWVATQMLKRKEPTMPNYVTCGFFVSGDLKELERFQTRMIVEVPVSPFEPDDLGQLFPSAAAAAGLKTVITFDFNGIIPMIPGLTHLEQERWAVENWGTKWNAKDYILFSTNDQHFSFFFLTAWDFPTPVFEALAKEFPTLVFEGFAYEEQGEFNLAGQWNGDRSWGPIDPDQGAIPDGGEDEEF